MLHTHLPFLEESVEVCIPDMDWDELEMDQQLRLLIRRLLKKLLDLQAQMKIVSNHARPCSKTD
jgi:hypothetical protein